MRWPRTWSVSSYETSRTADNGWVVTVRLLRSADELMSSCRRWMTRPATTSLFTRSLIVCVNGSMAFAESGGKKEVPWPTTIFIEAR